MLLVARSPVWKRLWPGLIAGKSAVGWPRVAATREFVSPDPGAGSSLTCQDPVACPANLEVQTAPPAWNPGDRHPCHHAFLASTWRTQVVTLSGCSWGRTFVSRRQRHLTDT